MTKQYCCTIMFVTIWNIDVKINQLFGMTKNAQVSNLIDIDHPVNALQLFKVIIIVIITKIGHTNKQVGNG